MTTRITPKGINMQNILLIQLRRDLPQDNDNNLLTGTSVTAQTSLVLASTAKNVKMRLSYDAILRIKTGWKRCQLIINDKHMRSH